jgi:acetolactate synthase-1/3 small subunit
MSNENHQLHTLVVRVENKAGVLARIAGLFARRGFNIDSLAVAPVVDESFSRITIVVDVESAPLDQIVKQLDKLVNVLDIVELSPTESVERELMVITVRSDAIDELKQLADEFSATWLDDRGGQVMISISSFPGRVEEFEERLKPYGIVELQRSGKIALHRLPD